MLKETDIWISPSKSGNGFTIRLPDGQVLVGSMESLRRLVDGEILGIKLSIIEAE